MSFTDPIPPLFCPATTRRDSVPCGNRRVTVDPATAATVSTLFTRSQPVEPIVLYRDSPWFGRQAVQTLYLFRGYGFRGGLRWQPQDESDIRAGRDRAGGARPRVGP
jgi:hypothetical protein